MPRGERDRFGGHRSLRNGLTDGDWPGGGFAGKSLDGTLLLKLEGDAVLAALVPPLRLLIMPHTAEAANLTSARHIGPFNLDNVTGVALGGTVITAGLGDPAASPSGTTVPTPAP